MINLQYQEKFFYDFTITKTENCKGDVGNI